MQQKDLLVKTVKKWPGKVHVLFAIPEFSKLQRKSNQQFIITHGG